MKSRNHNKKLVFKKVTIAALNYTQMGLVFGGKDALPTGVECSETDNCGTEECNVTLDSPCSMPGEVCAASGGISNCHSCLSSDPSTP